MIKRITQDKYIMDIDDEDTLNHMAFDNTIGLFPIPLLFKSEITNKVYVKSTGKDEKWCGYELYPCLTVKYATDKLQEDVGNILILDSFNISGQYNF